MTKTNLGKKTKISYQNAGEKNQIHSLCIIILSHEWEHILLLSHSRAINRVYIMGGFEYDFYPWVRMWYIIYDRMNKNHVKYTHCYNIFITWPIFGKINKNNFLGVLAHFTTLTKKWSGVGYHYVITRMKVLSHWRANTICIAIG